jgi:hypothetical protein
MKTQQIKSKCETTMPKSESEKWIGAIAILLRASKPRALTGRWTWEAMSVVEPSSQPQWADSLGFMKAKAGKPSLISLTNQVSAVTWPTHLPNMYNKSIALIFKLKITRT